MQANITNPVSNKFAELIHTLNYVADDIKIACAEASLEGNFTEVTKLSDASRQIQVFIKDANDLLNRWNKGILRPATPKKQVLPHKKTFTGKKPRSKLSVTIIGKQIQLDTATNTFVAALEEIGFERVASLGKKLSGVPLISKTPPTGYQNYKQCGPWFITTHSSTQDKKQLLEGLGTQLRIPVQVKIVEAHS
jgi:hypothetical protein